MNDIIRKYQSAETSHTHDEFHQIILPISGNLELEIEGRQGGVTGRTLGVVTSGQKHAFRASGNNNFLVLDIFGRTAQKNLEDVWARALDEPFHSMSGALLSLTDYAAYCSEQKSAHDWFETWQKLFLTTLECDLLNDLGAFPLRMKKAIDYMQNNMGDQISNSDLANVSCLSPARFYELFRQSMGVSPQQYLTCCRLKMAKRIIRQGVSLSQAASDVGFSDQSSFGRAFQKEYGVSPGQWRKQDLQTKIS